MGGLLFSVFVASPNVNYSGHLTLISVSCAGMTVNGCLVTTFLVFSRSSPRSYYKAEVTVDDEEPTSDHLIEAEIVQLVTEEEEEEEEEDADEEAEEDDGPAVVKCVLVHSAKGC